MKVAAFILTMFLAAVSAAGQVATAKDETIGKQYRAVMAKAEKMLGTLSYRSVWTKEFFESSSQPGKIRARTEREILRSDLWRTVEETFQGKPDRNELICVGKYIYTKTNDLPWARFDFEYEPPNGSIDAHRATNLHKYIPLVDFQGGKAHYYEATLIRTEEEFTSTGFVNVKHIRTERSWFTLDGKLLKKLDEATIEGREEVIRETTTYEYDPKDLKIEAPVK